MKTLKQLFVQDREKMTEKSFYQVLVSSICGILLCMIGLAGTTWAWFTVDIENTGNVLQIGAPAVEVFIGGTELTSGESLPLGECTIQVKHANEADVFQNKSTLYVTFSLDGEVKGHLVLNSQNSFAAEFKADLTEARQFTWVASWLQPGNQGQDLSLAEAPLGVAEEYLGKENAITASSGSTPTIFSNISPVPLLVTTWTLCSI